MCEAELVTPLSLGSLFDDMDLKGNGIELDSHITLHYLKEAVDSKEVECLLLDNNVGLINKLREERNTDENDFYVPLLSLFELSKFERDSDYLVLELKEGSDLYDKIVNVNKVLCDKYGENETFPVFKPHLTLAELEKGTADKYLNDSNFRKVLENSKFHAEDIVVSYGVEGEEDFRVISLTSFHTVDRFFRIRELKNW